MTWEEGGGGLRHYESDVIASVIGCDVMVFGVFCFVACMICMLIYFILYPFLFDNDIYVFVCFLFMYIRA